MATITLNLPDETVRFIAGRLAQGECTDASIYIASLVEFDRCWQEHERERIKRAAEAGLAQLDRGEFVAFESTQEILKYLDRRFEERLGRLKPEDRD